MVGVGRAVGAAGLFCAVAMLTGCGSLTGRACTANLGIARHAVVAGSGIPTGAIAQVCDPSGCSSATATRKDRVEVTLNPRVPEAQKAVVTAKVSVGQLEIAAPVTTTATPSPSTVDPDGCVDLIDYRFTVTVTPTG